MPGLDDDELPSLDLLDRKPVEGMLDVAKSKWTEDQMKMYQRGLDDNTTVVTFSMKVYYTIEVKNRLYSNFCSSLGTYAYLQMQHKVCQHRPM